MSAKLFVVTLAERFSNALPRLRQPLAGVALCAALGIAAEDAAGAAPWLPVGCFLAVFGFWLWRRRQQAWLCWLLIAAGFAALHAFRISAVPAAALATQLGPPGQETSPLVVRAVGRVLDTPRARPDARFARFTLALEHIDLGGGRRWDCRAPVSMSWPLTETPAAGDRVSFIGIARNIPAARNPGQFDFAALARRRGIRSEIHVDSPADGRVLEKARGPGSVLRRAAARTRAWAAATLRLDLADEPEVAAIVSGMILGLSEGSLEGNELGDTLQETGTLHFFAIDGLKIGLLAGIGLLALSVGGLRRATAGFLVVPLLAFYALATGLGPASIRATVMAAVLLGGLLIDRPTRGFNTLGAAAAMILAWDSNQLFSRGFQLSFVVVAVILLLERPVGARLRRLGAPDPFLPHKLLPRWRRAAEPARFWGLGIVGVSFAAWVGSLPLMAYWFHLVSPVSLLANIAVFPFALAVLGTCVLALAGGLVSEGWAIWMNNANWLFSKALLAIVKASGLIPGGHWYVGAPELSAAMPWRGAPAAELTVLDLGRGGSALHLRAGRADWLLDGGRPFDYGTTVRPYLRSRGVDRLDGLIARQNDSAHVGAAPLLLGDFHPRRIIASPLAASHSPAWRDFSRALTERRLGKGIYQRGDTLEIAPGVRLSVLHPGAALARPLADDRALVLVLAAAGRRVLLAANSGPATERWLLDNEAAQLPGDVLILGAHQNELSGGPDFLRAVAPRLIVREYDDANTPGRDRPPPAMLADGQIAAVLGRRAEVFRVKDDGAVTLRLWRDRIEARGFVSGRTATIWFR